MLSGLQTIIGTGAALLLAVACNDGDDTLVEAERVSLEQLRGGDYQMFTTAVDDGCLDGALEALFMPEGRAEPHPFEYPVYIPSLDELPASYSVDFREPFVGMDVTVTQLDDTTLQVEGSVMEAVALEGATGDCVADMVANAEFWAVSSGEVEGTAAIQVNDPRGSEGLCPVFEEDPCSVLLDLHAEQD